MSGLPEYAHSVTTQTAAPPSAQAAAAPPTVRTLQGVARNAVNLPIGILTTQAGLWYPHMLAHFTSKDVVDAASALIELGTTPIQAGLKNVNADCVEIPTQAHVVALARNVDLERTDPGMTEPRYSGFTYETFYREVE
jgi:hypothetical protein